MTDGVPALPFTPKTALAPMSGPKDAGLESENKPSFSQFSDVPIPTESEMDIEHTLILGSQDQWVGRLAFTTTHDTGEIFDFYRREMPKFSWAEVAVARAEISVLTYTREARVATLQISEGTIRGSRISLTVGPRDGEALPMVPIK